MQENVISFDLKGDFACFRKNDTNNIVYTTYNIIHKPAVLGIIGAILGLKGYSFSDNPEYLNKLKNLKLGISPKFKEPPKKFILTFNNSSGLASIEKGGVLQIKEQVMCDLENKISYTIYLDLDSINQEIKDNLLEKLNKNYSEFPIYFGKNEFFAFYENVRYYKKCEILSDELNTKIKIETIIPKNFIQNKLEINIFDTTQFENLKIIFEILPVSFDQNLIYCKEEFAWIVEGKVKLLDKQGIVKIEDNSEKKYIYLF
ncbi:MAG: CRISPR-associated protein Cas5 [candidate division WOR-3 bacterium]